MRVIIRGLPNIYERWLATLITRSDHPVVATTAPVKKYVKKYVGKAIAFQQLSRPATAATPGHRDHGAIEEMKSSPVPKHAVVPSASVTGVMRTVEPTVKTKVDPPSSVLALQSTLRTRWHSFQPAHRCEFVSSLPAKVRSAHPSAACTSVVVRYDADLGVHRQ